MESPVIGSPLPRGDGLSKVTGAAGGVADFDQPGQVHAVTVGASVGYGRIRRIDASRAARSPGVLAVISHLNAPRLANPRAPLAADPLLDERLQVLQDERVHFFGQPVCVIVAETLDQAERAAAVLRIDYEALPSAALADAAGVDPRAVRQDANVSAEARCGEADGAVAEAPFRCDATYAIAHELLLPMEPRATIAAWHDGRLTLWTRSPLAPEEATEIAAVFDLLPGHLRVVCPSVAGEFHDRLRSWPHVTLAAIAAQHVDRPVKLMLTRRQMSRDHRQRPRLVQHIALGAAADGRLVGIVHEGIGEASRYEADVEVATAVSAQLYACENVRTRYRLAPLDTSSSTFMRRPGESSGVHALESAMDELAFVLGMDPVELRLRNLTTGAHETASAKALRACYALGAARFGWAGRAPTPGTMHDQRWRLGWGMASATCLIEPRQPAHACGAVFVEVAVDPDLGVVRVRRAVGAFAPGRIADLRFAQSRCARGMAGGIALALMGEAVFDGEAGAAPDVSPLVEPHGGSVAGACTAFFVDTADVSESACSSETLAEIALVGMAPAIANAVFHATGRRVRDLPIRIEHLL